MSRLRLFLSLLWRPCPFGLGRLSWRTSWAVAGILRGRRGGPFDAVLLGEGWVVLSPWITTPEGADYRHHVGDFGRDGKAARHLAAELNRTARP